MLHRYYYSNDAACLILFNKKLLLGRPVLTQIDYFFGETTNGLCMLLDTIR